MKAKEEIMDSEARDAEIQEAFVEALEKLDSVRECLLRLQKQITEEA